MTPEKMKEIRESYWDRARDEQMQATLARLAWDDMRSTPFFNTAATDNYRPSPLAALLDIQRRITPWT